MRRWLLALLLIPKAALCDELHWAVRSMPPTVETSIESVARYLAARELEPFQRVKALHDYVADRVAYDAAAFANDSIPDEDGDAEAVFRNHRAVCEGYAKLLSALGRAIDVPIRVASGHVKWPTDYVRHAWNVVDIGGRSYMIDVTWDAGYVRGREFRRSYSTKYLLVPLAHVRDRRETRPLVDHAWLYQIRNDLNRLWTRDMSSTSRRAELFAIWDRAQRLEPSPTKSLALSIIASFMHDRLPDGNRSGLGVPALRIR
jgi:hypothetical protein